MPERKQTVHYCVKCGKGMAYKEKKMLYIYDVKYRKHFASTDYVPVKRMAFNLCEDCCAELEDVILKWKSGSI